MIEFRFHSLGGEGAVIAGKILGFAATLENKYAQIIPAYQATRRGGNVEIHIRLSDSPIDITSRVYQPDGVILFNEKWEKNKEKLLTGLKEKGFAVINSRRSPQDFPIKQIKIGIVDATKVALDTIGRTIPNTAMLGALLKTTDLVTLDSLEVGIRRVLPPRIHDANINALQSAYDKTMVN